MSTEERRVQLVTEVDNRRVRPGFAEITREAGTMADAVAERSRRAETAVGGIGSGAGRSAAQVEAAQRALVASIQRTTVAAESGGRSTAAYYELMARQRGVDPAILAPYLAQLRAVEAAQARANQQTRAGTPAVRELGNSAAQTAAALRGVPAQFTDIVTSIQGGQSPLTVLLQQGGQLKDMFGGAREAASGLFGYVKSLISPTVILGAAVAVLAAAYYTGAQEARAFTTAITLTGNAAGTTSGRLGDMAKRIGDAVGTQGAAAESLAALVGTGKVSADNLERFGLVAIKGQRALGQAVADTAGEFADLAKTPVQTLEKLNEKYRFLTGAIYEQVKALTDQGRGYDAGVVAQQAYATAMENVADRVGKNLGYMQKRWQELGDFAKGAWDKMLDVGREESLEAKLAKVQAKLDKKPTTYNLSPMGSEEYQRFRRENEEVAQGLRNQIALETTKANLQADQQRFNAADLEWSKGKFQYMSRAKQLETELTAEKEKGLAAGVSDVEIEERLGAVRKKYSDIFNDGIDSQIEAIKRRAAVEDLLTQRIISRITATRALGEIREEDAINQTAAAEDKAFARKRANLAAELELTKGKVNSLKDQQSLAGEIEALDVERANARIKREQDLRQLIFQRAQASRELFNSGVNAAADERNALSDQIKAQLDYNEEIGRSAEEVLILKNARLLNVASLKDESAAALESLEPGSQVAAQYREQATLLRSLATAQRDGFVKQKDPYLAIRASLIGYRDDAVAVGSQIGDAMTNAFRGAEDAFVSFVTTGKLNFASLATSIVADLARIQAKKALAGLADLALSSLFGSPTGPGTTGFDGYANIAGARAAGGPVTGGASYLVGEKGPEIFTPSSSGRIIANHAIGGGAGGGDININTAVTVTEGGASSQTSGDSSAQGRALAEMINTQVKDVLVRERRQGGILWNMQQGRA